MHPAAGGRLGIGVRTGTYHHGQSEISFIKALSSLNSGWIVEY